MAATIIPNFRDATRMQAKASIMIEGLTGKGKSGLALALGYILAGGNWQKVFAGDTENKSLDLFEGLRLHTGDAILPFKKLDILRSHGYAPSNYLAVKEAAINAGGLAFIADSVSHMWQRSGGVLDLVTQAQQKNSKLNNYTAWGVPEVVEEKEAIFDVIRDSNIHVISTVRVKEKFEVIAGEGLKSLGEQQLMMPDIKYEPDLVLHMVQAGNQSGRAPMATVIKSRYAIFDEGETYSFTEDLMLQLKSYLEEGADPEQLKELQRQDYINEITKILDTNASAATVWTVLKENAGHKETKLIDMPLETLRFLFGQLVN